MQKKKDKKIGKRTYWLVFVLGISYVLILGLFTYFFNNPI